MLYKIAIIISEFDAQISSLIEKSVLSRLTELDILPMIYKVFGVITKRETLHYDYLCNQVSYGCQKIALEQMIPTIFGLLTCANEQQAFDHLADIPN
jgi:6,7-dimethyl-8-ribityllumazine synthase